LDGYHYMSFLITQFFSNVTTTRRHAKRYLMSNSKFKTSRFGRLQSLAGLATRTAGSAFGEAIKGIAGGKDVLLQKVHEQTAQRLLETLGEMKGLPMKLGQMLSYMDGVIPIEHQHIYRNVLSRLQVKSQPMPWEIMQKEIEVSLGGELSQFFAEINSAPIAAASIGQVYQAHTRDGVEVAVKVQYPNIANAIDADSRNIESVLKVLRRAIPNLDTTRLTQDFLSRLNEETDYYIEAEHQEEFRTLWKNDPRVVIPGVVKEFTRRNILVTELMVGKPLSEFQKLATQVQKNKAGEILYWFTVRSILSHGMFNADPHPGNFLFLDDDRVVFFGFWLRTTLFFKRSKPSAPYDCLDIRRHHRR
jgi:predicted unusual protein kinase regulating ubiquinone biosynthesis (AarF/ABC1/UbiB family)